MGVSEIQRIRRQQILREVEGYLELLTACESQWSVTAKVRDRLAARALELLDRVGKRRVSQYQLLFLRGYALRIMERYAEAVEPLQQAAELESQNIDIWLLLGWCYKRCGRLDMAIQALEEARSAEPREAIVHYNLACYWSLANNAKAALRCLARALELDPQYRDLVAGEPDFDPIRTHPEFRQMTSVIV